MAIIGTNSTTGMSLLTQTSASSQKLTQDSGYIYLAGSNEEVFRVAYHNRSTQVGDGSGVQVGVYNLGTGPTVDGATLIASGTVTAVASSWCTLDITPVALVAGNYYAVAMRVISATNIDTSRIALTNGTSTRGSGATALTSPWTVALSTTSFLYAMYAETRAASTGLTITSVTPASFDDGITGIVIAGSGFGASQGSSTVDIGDQAQTVTAWSDTRITITSARGSNSMGAGQLKVTIR